MTIRFTTYERLNNNPIEDMELLDRSINCLKRSKIYTVGDIISLIESNTLHTIRGCGVKIQNDVKNALFNYELQNAYDVVNFLKKVEVL